MSTLSEQHCEPCQGGIPPLEPEAVRDLRAQLGPDWELVAGHHLVRTWKFPDFAAALSWVDRIGALAEAEGHHPDLHLGWGWVRCELWTHKVDGLTLWDFVLAAKIDDLGREGR